MDSYARQMLLAYLDADLRTCEYPWSSDRRPRTHSLWNQYARAVKDATRRWPPLARWEPTTERIPATNPLMAGLHWEILGGEPQPRYPYDVVEEMLLHMKQYAARSWGGYIGTPSWATHLRENS